MAKNASLVLSLQHFKCYRVGIYHNRARSGPGWKSCLRLHIVSLGFRSCFSPALSFHRKMRYILFLLFSFQQHRSPKFTMLLVGGNLQRDDLMMCSIGHGLESVSASWGLVGVCLCIPSCQDGAFCAVPSLCFSAVKASFCDVSQRAVRFGWVSKMIWACKRQE